MQCGSQEGSLAQCGSQEWSSVDSRLQGVKPSGPRLQSVQMRRQTVLDTDWMLTLLIGEQGYPPGSGLVPIILNRGEQLARRGWSRLSQIGLVPIE